MPRNLSKHKTNIHRSKIVSRKYLVSQKSLGTQLLKSASRTIAICLSVTFPLISVMQMMLFCMRASAASEKSTGDPRMSFTDVFRVQHCLLSSSVEIRVTFKLNLLTNLRSSWICVCVEKYRLLFQIAKVVQLADRFAMSCNTVLLEWMILSRFPR